jgi:hypothetical protein
MLAAVKVDLPAPEGAGNATTPEGLATTPAWIANCLRPATAVMLISVRARVTISRGEWLSVRVCPPLMIRKPDPSDPEMERDRPAASPLLTAYLKGANNRSKCVPISIDASISTRVPSTE